MSGDSSKPVTPKPGPWWHIAFVARSIYVIAIVLFISSLLAAIIFWAVGWELESSKLTTNQMLAFALWSSGMPGILLTWYVMRKETLRDGLGVRSVSLRRLGLVVGAFFVYVIISNGFLYLVRIYSEVDIDQAQDIGIDIPTSTAQLALSFVTLVIFTPISEELLFRGFLYRRLAAQYHFFVAAFISSVLFGLVHLQANVGVDTAVLGFVSAWLVSETNSVLPSIALHSLKNAIAFLFVFIIQVPQ